MVGPNKRLRRKTTVSQKGCSQLLMLTSEWWMQFAYPVGSYYQTIYVLPSLATWRLLSKAWREIWDQGCRVKLSLHQDHVSQLRFAAQVSQLDLLFRRDSVNKILYYYEGYMQEGLRCIVSMSWKTFMELRPILVQVSRLRNGLQQRPCACLHPDCFRLCAWRGVSFQVFAFVQTGFCLQSDK